MLCCKEMGIQNNIGQKYEDMLSSFLSYPFLVDFVHQSPYYFKSNNKKEVCDVLIEDDNNAIIIQLKAHDKDRSQSGKNSQKWAQNVIKKAFRQTLGAIGTFKKFDIIAYNAHRQTIKFDKGTITPKHGIVIVDYNESPFFIGTELSRRDESGIPIHFCSFNDFVILSQHLMTLPDLFEYLNERGSIPAWATPMLNNEKDAYAYYHNHQGKFSPTICLEDFNNQWDNMVDNQERYTEKVLEDEESEFYNSIISNMREIDTDLVDKIPQYIEVVENADNPIRFEILKQLNRLRRLHRREVSKKFIEKIKLADNCARGFNYFAYFTENPDVIFVFLASRNKREKRVEELSVLVYCINSTYDAKQVIGIATQNFSINEDRIFDFMAADYSTKDFDPNTVKRCKELFGKINFHRLYDFPEDCRKIIDN